MARRPPPISSGFAGKCPQCGRGNLFDGFLTFAKSCQACQADFSSDDTGDGPTIFVIFIVGIFIVPMALAFQLIFDASTFLTLSIWIPVIILVSLGLLRLLRGIMFNLAWSNKAREIRNSEIRQKQSQAETPKK